MQANDWVDFVKLPAGKHELKMSACTEVRNNDA